jgi:hypothetical protein
MPLCLFELLFGRKHVTYSSTRSLTRTWPHLSPSPFFLLPFSRNRSRTKGGGRRRHRSPSYRRSLATDITDLQSYLRRVPSHPRSSTQQRLSPELQTSLTSTLPPPPPISPPFLPAAAPVAVAGSPQKRCRCPILSPVSPHNSKESVGIADCTGVKLY